MKELYCSLLRHNVRSFRFPVPLAVALLDYWTIRKAVHALSQIFSQAAPRFYMLMSLKRLVHAEQGRVARLKPNS